MFNALLRAGIQSKGFMFLQIFCLNYAQPLLCSAQWLRHLSKPSSAADFCDFCSVFIGLFVTQPNDAGKGLDIKSTLLWC